MAIKYLSGAEVEAQLGKGTQIVNYTAEWCGPCKMMAPTFEALAQKVEVFKIDADQNREHAIKNQVQGLPTTFIYKDGQLVEKFVGFVPKEVIEAKL